jgi:peptide/nickel transport system substrate-binding protein
VCAAAGLVVAGSIAAGAGAATAAKTATKTASKQYGPAITITCNFGPQFSTHNYNPFGSAGDGSTQFMYLPLEAFNGYTGALVPELASASKALGDTGASFTLRPGLKWSNGKSLTAADVVFTFAMLKSNPSLDTFGVSPLLKSVTSKGDTVTFRFNGPNAFLLPQIANTLIVPRSQWAPLGNKAATFTNPTPVVDGPFRLGSQSSLSETLVPNKDYFDAATMRVGQINCNPQNPGPTQIPQLQAGQWDWDNTGDFTPGGLQTDFAAKDPSVNHYWIVPNGDTTIFLNNSQAPLNNAHFRLGLSDALSRSQIGRTAAAAGYEPGAAQTGLIPNAAENAFANPALPNGGKVTQNVSAAKQEFASAGDHYSGGNLVDGSGNQVSITLNVPNGFTDWIAAAQIIKQDWQAVGINVSIDEPQIPALIGGLAGGSYQATMWLSNQTGEAYYDLEEMLYSKAANTNFSRVNIPAADAAIQQASSTTSASTQKKAIQKLESIVYNEVPFINLMNFPGWYEYRTNKYTGWPSASNPYAFGLLPVGQQGNKSTSVLLVISHLKPTK